MSPVWPPPLAADASWRDIVRAQLAPWEAVGLRVSKLLRETDGMRRPPGTHAAPAAAVASPMAGASVALVHAAATTRCALL